MTLLEVALQCIKRGWYVIPCHPKTKIAAIKGGKGEGWRNSFHAEQQVRQWWESHPDANPAIACGPSNLVVFDVDHGLQNHEDYLKLRETMGLPETYAVRTGRRDAYGVQVYFSGNTRGIDFSTLGCAGQVRSEGGYVMAAGCIHDKTGELYEVLHGDPDAVAPAPACILELEPVKVKSGEPGKPMEKIPEGAGRHAALTSFAGTLRHKGFDRDSILAQLIPANQSMCEVPVSDADLEHIADSVGSYALPEPDPVAVLGSSKKRVENYEDAEALDDVPRPRYPDEVWNGTPYGEFAELCTRDNYIPKKFFSESMRTVVGAIVGDRLNSPVDGGSPRVYTVLIAPPGSGKGTAFSRVSQFFSEERWDGLERTEAPLLWTSPSEFAWRGRGMGAQICTAASAPGLMKAIEERKLKKGETINPIEIWQPIPRIITMAEEVRSLFANFANESTGAGLESVLCELFDRCSFTATATKDRPPAAGRLMFSMLGGITKDGWDAVFSRVESVESGFLSRVNVVGTEETRTKGTLKVPDFTALQNKLFPFLLDLEKHPRNIDATPTAMAYMDRWYSRLELPEGVSRARLNIHAWRTALHLAWLHGHGSILDVDVDGGIKVAEYLAKMREFYAPPEGETRGARCEAAIRKVMRARRKITLRELRRKTNSNRFGIGVWDKALLDLGKAGEVRIEQGDGGKRFAILLKIKD